MTFPKLLAIFAVLLFGTIGVIALYKSSKNHALEEVAFQGNGPVEVVLGVETRIIKTEQPSSQEATNNGEFESRKAVQPIDDNELPEASRIEELFNKGDPKLPIVETITYKSRVPWQKGRPAWLSDYATYYATSRHFIARSLNGKPDYFKQDVAEGDRFNVLRKDKNINFYLLIDVSRCKMWFYYIDLDANSRVLIKTYQVGLGRLNDSCQSGMLTPLGKYTLGGKIAIYKPKMFGFHNNQKVEMIQVFGTRWIPFDKEISGCSASSKGFGIHGVPWTPNASGEFVEDRGSIGKYESDGCIRLATEDMEELFAIIITKPSIVELVRDFHEVVLPGVEKEN